MRRCYNTSLITLGKYLEAISKGKASQAIKSMGLAQRQPLCERWKRVSYSYR